MDSLFFQSSTESQSVKRPSALFLGSPRPVQRQGGDNSVVHNFSELVNDFRDRSSDVRGQADTKLRTNQAERPKLEAPKREEIKAITKEVLKSAKKGEKLDLDEVEADDLPIYEEATKSLKERVEKAIEELNQDIADADPEDERQVEIILVKADIIDRLENLVVKLDRTLSQIQDAIKELAIDIDFDPQLAPSVSHDLEAIVEELDDELDPVNITEQSLELDAEVEGLIPVELQAITSPVSDDVNGAVENTSTVLEIVEAKLSSALERVQQQLEKFPENHPQLDKLAEAAKDIAEKIDKLKADPTNTANKPSDVEQLLKKLGIEFQNIEANVDVTNARVEKHAKQVNVDAYNNQLLFNLDADVTVAPTASGTFSDTDAFLNQPQTKMPGQVNIAKPVKMAQVLEVLNRLPAKLGNGSTQELFMKLDPGHLGSLDLQITREDGQISIRALVQTEQAVKILEKQFEKLAQVFGEKGLELKDVEVTKSETTSSSDMQRESKGGSYNQARDEQKQRSENTTAEWLAMQDSTMSTSFDQVLDGINNIEA